VGREQDGQRRDETDERADECIHHVSPSLWAEKRLERLREFGDAFGATPLEVGAQFRDL
jgi:hypothetical protein